MLLSRSLSTFFALAILATTLRPAPAAAQLPICPAQWDQASPTFSPPARSAGLLVSTPGFPGGGVLLFGGSRTFAGDPPFTQIFGDTVIWNGINWTNQNPVTTPSPRRDPAGSFDSLRNRVYLYGGNLATGLAFNDLWSFDGSTWTQITHPQASLPSNRMRSIMVYDALRDRIVMFGGSRSTTPGAGNKLLDTWEMDPSAIASGGTLWTLKEASSETSPANADNFPAVFDAARAVTLAVSYTSTFNVALGANHEWTGTAWTKTDTTASLPPRASFGLTHDPVRARTILYGGTNGVTGQRYGDTWEFDGSSWAQTRQSSQGPGNANNTFLRQFVAIAHDTIRASTVHFSGTTAPISTVAIDTWLYSTLPAPTNAADPQNLTINEGQNATFRADVNVTSGRTGTFQWLRNGQPITDGPAGATPGGGTVSGASGTLPSGIIVPLFLNITSAQLPDAGNYSLRVLSACGTPAGFTTTTASLGVIDLPNPCPSFDQQPQPVNAFVAADVSLTASVVVPPGVVSGAFAWLRNGLPVSNGPDGTGSGGGIVSGAAGPLPASPGGPIVLSIAAAQEPDSGTYTLQLTAAECTALDSSPAPLSITPAPTCPQIAADPQDVEGVVGQTIAITATINIGPNTTGTFQWSRDSVPVSNGLGGAATGGGTVSGASGPLPAPGPSVPISLLITGARIADSGLYHLEVTSSACIDPPTITSAAAALNVTPVPPPPPPADTCDLAPTYVEGVYPFSTFFATTDGPDEPAACDFFGYTHVENDVWFHYLPGLSGFATVSLCDSSYDTRLALYTANTCPTQPGTASGCNENGCTDTQQSKLTFRVFAGVPVLLRIGGFGGGTGDGTINITTAPELPFPADSCADAPNLADGMYTFSTVGTTTDGPDEPGPCDFFGYTQVDSDVWFRYSPTCTGSATISMCGSNFDTKMVIYSGFDCPTAPATAIACSEDACDFQSSITIPVEAGQAYLVRLGGFGGSTGDVLLNVACTAPPTCTIDFNNDGIVSPDDLDEFITTYFSEPPDNSTADFNNDGIVSPDDLDEFITMYFEGC